MKAFGHLWRRADAALRAAVARRTRRLAFTRRADPVLAGLALSGAAGLYLLAQAAVGAADRAGIFDPPLVAPLADQRLLDNVRRDLPAKEFLAAVLHAPEQALYLSQAGGSVHRYDTATRLWSRETPRTEPGLDLVALRSGCGDDPEAAPSACADSESLWALGRSGALLQRRNGAWRTIIGDNLFTGRDGQPVEGASLTAAATSADGRWLLLGTRAQGIGLYDTHARRWHVPAAEVLARLPERPIDRIVWWRGAFYLGTAAGAVRVTAVAEPEAEPLPELDGRILDLAVGGQDEELLVLEERSCAQGPGECLRLSRLGTPGGAPETLIAEENRYPRLDLAGLFFAQQQGDRLLVAGDTGVYAYDPSRRSWQRIDDVRVTAAERDRDGFWYGHQGGAAFVVEGMRRETWALGEERVAQFLPLPGRALALTAAGNVYELRAGAAPLAVFAPGGTAAPADRLATALATGDHVLLAGSGHAMLHHLRRRTYRDLPPTALDGWIVDPGTPKVASGGLVFGMPARDGAATGVALDLARLEDGMSPVVGLTPPGSRPGLRPAALARWDSGGRRRRRRAGPRHRCGRAADGGTGAGDRPGRHPRRDGRRFRPARGDRRWTARL